jgi:sulfatase maturation enzyme AslB (radical SAM superfamily)
MIAVQTPVTKASQRPAHFYVLAKPTGALCNLDCKYGFFLGTGSIPS